MKSVVQKLEALLSVTWLPAAECLDIPLAGKEVYRMDGDSRGVKLICHEGLAWITQKGDPADYLLGVGQSFTVTRPGTVLIQGLPVGHLRLVPVIHGIGTPRHSWRIRSSLGTLSFVGR